MRTLLQILLISIVPWVASPMFSQVTVKVQTQSPLYAMKGGLGASWHAIRKSGPWKNFDYDFPASENNPRGSALEGNPPLANEVAWKQLCQLARWLGLNWVRVELSQLMYEPQDGKFDWDNEEMQTLYRILDYCEQNQVDVFLQQMWTEVSWNAFRGVHPLISAPQSLDKFGDGMATLVEHLVKQKNYSCIRWVCITNEPPGGTWGYWWSSGSYPCVPLGDGFRAVREAMDRRGLKIPISGPDWTDLPPFDASKLDFDSHLGAYDIHSYQGVGPREQETLSLWASWAHERNKPFFLSEMGNMKLGWGKANPGPRSFAAALSNAETIIRGIRAGVDAFNRWSFVNRGDLDGQWQLVRTFDIASQKHLKMVTPEPVAYYGYGIMTRFLSKYSSRLKDEIIGESGSSLSSFLTVTLKSPGGELTTYLLNLGVSPVAARLRYEGLPGNFKMNAYQVLEQSLTKPGYDMNPIQQWDGKTSIPVLEQSLPPKSITVLTSYSLRHADDGVIFDPAK
jgi:hypothetical protein